MLTSPRYTGRQVQNRQAPTRSCSMSTTSPWATPASCAGTRRTSGTPPTTPHIRRSSTQRRSMLRRRCFGVAATVPEGSTSGTAPATSTPLRARCTARCATGRCRVNGPMARRTTDAATPRSTPSRTRSTTRAASTDASETSSVRSTPHWLAPSPRIADTVAAMADHQDTPQVDQQLCCVWTAANPGTRMVSWLDRPGEALA
ncbi:hypothetical protein ACN27B_29465 [Micromonospora sp. WMMD754]|uniref:hypothetical protein n=1 Tax=Micromonospora sp. WMMD754 TaxID=3404114 RepID=UPI003BF50097